MNRCRCGVWTDYGMTCVACRSEQNYKQQTPPTEPSVEGVVEDVETEDEDEET